MNTKIVLIVTLFVLLTVSVFAVAVTKYDYKTFWTKIPGLAFLAQKVYPTTYLAVGGQDWFVRPPGTSYGTGDGTSHENAWNDLMNVVWGEAGVGPGDTLYVCGTHIQEMTYPWGRVAVHGKIYAKGGTSDSARVTIDGDCSQFGGKDGIVHRNYLHNYPASGDRDGNAWNPVSGYSNVWKASLSGNHPLTGYFEDIVDESFTVLDREYSISGVQGNPGSWFKDGYTLYVHTSDSGDPHGRIYPPVYGYMFAFLKNKYINVKNIAFYGSQMTGGSFSQPSHITFDNVKVIWGKFILVDGMNYFEILNSEIAWTSNAIYTISGTNNAPHHWRFSGNYPP